MLVVYMSLTGQTRKFVQKLPYETLEITLANAFDLEVHQPYIIVAPTYDVEATDILNDFIETGNNQAYLKGVCGSGNLNFNDLYCFTAKDLARDYHVPLLHCFEFQGNEKDVEIVKEKVNEIG
ncbi:class Ib ribonucleoside-diphosphate reductase assembly flavoprotein NrdI [Atopobacter phocae]|uniref:class Ib ribonucleoside-diphosphate reductase assembly flavoprotein NrdI n=1 Tax=Atopobacter phocae TaxID=136492 RepID=UPI0004719C67|nr:class Ib ribonucleoside-diphosphate reductase assembly flavoprotein NrdI [Atopobacter phocae]